MFATFCFILLKQKKHAFLQTARPEESFSSLARKRQYYLENKKEFILRIFLRV